MHITDYINHIQNNGFFGGELEISIAASIYNISIATYNEIINNNILVGLTPYGESGMENEYYDIAYHPTLGLNDSEYADQVN